MKIWDFETTVDPKFQLFLTTQLANPVFTPELLADAVLIDFNVTVKGLEDQLLAHVVSVERAVRLCPINSLAYFCHLRNVRSVIEA